ncbi:MAG: CHAP domain-containing protein [Bifidobacteriaceae bacterium]|jgi:hypothetical protein|nr:CHAP domain-containing protein [Bifidobacteriaceae bacterium]
MRPHDQFTRRLACLTAILVGIAVTGQSIAADAAPSFMPLTLAQDESPGPVSQGEPSPMTTPEQSPQAEPTPSSDGVTPAEPSQAPADDATVPSGAVDGTGVRGVDASPRAPEPSTPAAPADLAVSDDAPGGPDVPAAPDGEDPVATGVPGDSGPAAALEVAAQSLTLHVSATTVRAGERVRVNGHAADGKRVLPHARVSIQRGGAGQWETAVTVRANSAGTYSAFVWIGEAMALRAIVRDGDRVLVGTQLKVAVGATRRTLADRTEELRDVFGKAGTIRTLSRRGRVKARLETGVVVRHRALGRGAMLVEVTHGSRAETWVVKGAIKTYYVRHGGPSGSLGIPKQDPRCALPDGGCVQTFTRGTLYSRPGKIGTSTLRGARGDIDAVLRTQVGFTQKGEHYGKRVPTVYQRWAGSEAAWCSILLAWAADRAGHPDTIPTHRHFRDYRAWLRKDMPRLKSPEPGALVIMNGAEALGHAAFVESVDAKRRSIRIIDGNWNMRVRRTTVRIAANMEFYWPY